jgi:hypothetical protein
MTPEFNEFIQTVGVTILAVLGIAGVVAIVLFIILLTQVRKIDVPPGAGFGETLLHTPLIVVLFLDVLDLALDFLSAPIAWVVLDRIGLKGLRAFATIESFIPFTQVIPTMSLAWIGVRLLGPGRIESIEHGGAYSQYKRREEAEREPPQNVTPPSVYLPPGPVEKSPPEETYDYYSD